MITDTKNNEEWPFVSVIVPLYNAESEVEDLIDALCTQTYPKASYEILFIDNGSTDGTREKIQTQLALHKGKLLLLEEKNIQGSYAARNRGLETAQGSIIAFTDADCRPVQGWLEAGVATLVRNEADLIGGNVNFTFSGSKPSAAEQIDARTNMQMEKDIVNRGVTKTANLFTRKDLFDAIGSFRSDLRSGGDVEWTLRATQAGYKLVYAEQAEVKHPARGWKELFVKQIRVGRGQVQQKTGKKLTTDANVIKIGHSIKSLVLSGEESAFMKMNMLFAFFWARMGTLTGRLIGTMERNRRKI